MLGRGTGHTPRPVRAPVSVVRQRFVRKSRAFFAAARGSPSSTNIDPKGSFQINPCDFRKKTIYSENPLDFNLAFSR